MLRRIGRSLKARSYRSNVSGWYFLGLASRLDLPDALPGALEFRVLQGDDREMLHHWLLEHRETYPWVYFPEEICSAQRNDHCYPVLLEHGRIIGFMKLAHRRVYIHDFEAEINLPAGVSFIYDTFVDPERRGAGLGAALLGHAATWLRERHARGILCHIEDWNTPSLRAFSKAGFVLLGHVRFLRLSFFRWWLIDGSTHRAGGLLRWLEDSTGDRR